MGNLSKVSVKIVQSVVSLLTIYHCISSYLLIMITISLMVTVRFLVISHPHARSSYPYIYLAKGPSP